MKKLLEIGDSIKVKKRFNDKSYEDDIRKLAGNFVIIREVVDDGNFYRIKETEGLTCDDLWYIDDFIT